MLIYSDLKAFLWVCTCVFTCGGQMLTLQVFLYCSVLFLRQDLSLDPELHDWLGWMTSLQGSSSPTSHSALTEVHCSPWLLCGWWDSETRSLWLYSQDLTRRVSLGPQALSLTVTIHGKLIFFRKLERYQTMVLIQKISRTPSFCFKSESIVNLGW